MKDKGKRKKGEWVRRICGFKLQYAELIQLDLKNIIIQWEKEMREKKDEEEKMKLGNSKHFLGI